MLGNDPFERGAAEREPAPPRAEGSRSTSPRASLAAGARAERSAAGAPVWSGGPPTATPAPIPIPVRPEPGAAASGAESKGPGTPPPTSTSILEGAAARLGAAERRVDAALEGLEARVQDLAARSGVPSAPQELREAVARLLPAARARLSQAAELVRLLEPPERLERFGMDPRFAERFDAVLEALCALWWRVGVVDVAHVPATGPAIVVANHAGTVPWDALVLRHALRREHPAKRELWPLLEDAECDLPFLVLAAVRYGAIRATPEAAHAVLAAGDLVSVFPEGSAVARKAWRDRYHILRFGRGGFVKVALRARAPIVPCAIVGSEEASPAISRTGWLAERLGIPLVPGTSALRFGTAALLPLPSRWTLRFGAPVDVSGHGPEAADDPAVVAQIAERVRTTLQKLLDEGVAARRSVYL